MKIVILDGYCANPGDISWDEIASLGELTVYDRTPPELVIERAREADAVLMNKIVFTGDMLDQCPKLKFIGIMATGYNIIDLPAAEAHGVTVCNVPAYSTASVVQHTFALLLELCARVGAHSASVQAGDWSKNPDFCYWLTSPTELSGKTIGLVGFGQIGRGVAEVAKAFGMKVVATAAHPKPSENDVTMTDLQGVLTGSDIISLHCPLTPDNAEMINAASIAQMKRGALLINTARGGLVNEADVAFALKSGALAGYAADTLTEEPPVSGSPLIGAPNCILTPHIAWASAECRKRLISVVAENLRCYAAGHPQNIVNKLK